eukprot:NODE_2875_length_1099_cov_4.552381_g2637_i0.p1 GENE.NODE_2875_length_1099_cov_4.552381_g2637_i0~~NODE_2875_length_1099_cov_4.552381_g2637_i0.p1  ORF type:complete len:314 (+),score=45.67 NODE_2875_length_1099_cov_4.552381_g2637_i0:70-1011(+)
MLSSGDDAFSSNVVLAKYRFSWRRRFLSLLRQQPLIALLLLQKEDKQGRLCTCCTIDVCAITSVHIVQRAGKDRPAKVEGSDSCTTLKFVSRRRTLTICCEGAVGDALLNFVAQSRMASLPEAISAGLQTQNSGVSCTAGAAVRSSCWPFQRRQALSHPIIFQPVCIQAEPPAPSPSARDAETHNQRPPRYPPAIMPAVLKTLPGVSEPATPDSGATSLCTPRGQDSVFSHVVMCKLPTTTAGSLPQNSVLANVSDDRSPLKRERSGVFTSYKRRKSEDWHAGESSSIASAVRADWSDPVSCVRRLSVPESCE